MMSSMKPEPFDMLWEALILTVVDIPMVFVSLRLMKGAATLTGCPTRVILGKLHGGGAVAWRAGPAMLCGEDEREGETHVGETRI